jgi:hypothetical protein
MNRRFAIVGLTAGVAVSFLSCSDFSSPRGIVLTAGWALQHGDLSSFKGTLVGQARQRFGNPVGLARLRKDFAKATNLKTGIVMLKSMNKVGEILKRTYFVDVLSGDRRMLTATVMCETERLRQIHPLNGLNDLDSLTDTKDSYDDYTTCKISDLN